MGHFFGLSYPKIALNNQVENRFFVISSISVPCPHAQLTGCTVIKKLCTFLDLGGRDRSQSPPCWIFRVKQIYKSTASERTIRLSHNGLQRQTTVTAYFLSDLLRLFASARRHNALSGVKCKTREICIVRTLSHQFNSC